MCGGVCGVQGGLPGVRDIAAVAVRTWSSQGAACATQNMTAIGDRFIQPCVGSWGSVV